LDPTQIIQEMREEYWREISSAEAEGEEDRDQVLVAEVGGERFALGAQLCKTIVKAGRVTRVPRLPSHMLGVINLRGQIISVVDLGQLLGLPSSSAGPKARLVVTESRGVRTAFLVEAVVGIEWVEKSRVRSPESLQSAVKAEYVKGHVAPVKEEKWVTYLDVDRMVHGPELMVGRK